MSDDSEINPNPDPRRKGPTINQLARIFAICT